MPHTPGPWKATKDPHSSWSDYCIGMESDVARIDRVAVCSECDAQLIAAAPELLAALQKYVEHFGDPLRCANAAIAKALRTPPNA